MDGVDAELDSDRKLYGAMISTIEDGSMTLPASNNRTLTSMRKPTQPRPVFAIQTA
jgi:hypothetical protein